jgi:hypothetical protein
MGIVGNAVPLCYGWGMHVVGSVFNCVFAVVIYMVTPQHPMASTRLFVHVEIFICLISYHRWPWVRKESGLPVLLSGWNLS